MPKSPVSCEEDFSAWTQRTAELLRKGRLDEVDAEHLAEAVDDMGGRERLGLKSRLRVLLLHLLRSISAARLPLDELAIYHPHTTRGDLSRARSA